MSNVAKLEDRVTELEIKLGYQQENIASLNDTITKQWAEIDRLRTLMDGMVEYLKEQKDHATSEAGSEPPPPHY